MIDELKENNEKTITHEFDYSNIVPTVEHIGILVQSCEDIYHQFVQLIEQDTQKNEKLKSEYQFFEYGKCYCERFKVMVYSSNYGYIEIINYQSYLDAVKNKQINCVNSLEICLDLGFYRGSYHNKQKHRNEFRITFKPYNIKMIRKSNFDDSMMMQIENRLNNLLKQFSTVNTIFCTKDN